MNEKERIIKFLQAKKWWVQRGWWRAISITILANEGRGVLLGLFRNRNTWNRRYLCSFGSYSVRSAPESRMDRMEGIRFTRNRQNTRSFGKFLLGNHTRPPAPVACADTVVLRSPLIPFPDLKHVGVFFSKLKFRVFFYS